MRTILLLGTFFLTGAFTKGYHTLHFEDFSIEVPKNWKYIKRQGIDSFVGEIRGPKVNLSFDCSDMGHAGIPIQSPEEYINRQMLTSYSSRFNRPNVIYTRKENVEKFKIREMKKLNTTDSSLVKVEPFIVPSIKIYLPTEKHLEKYKDADYIIDLTHNDSTITVGLTLPSDIKNHNFKIDTVGQYIIKTVWPKQTGNGITGVSYRKVNSKFTLGIFGERLGEQEQNKVLQAFKTIHVRG
jgi:hypothetical protein